MNDRMKDFYEQVYSQDSPEGDAHGWIQWKGTSVCMDIHCKCGRHGHMDADFFYHYACPTCGRRYAVGQVVKLIELTEEQAQHVMEHHVGFQMDELEEDEQPHPSVASP